MKLPFQLLGCSGLLREIRSTNRAHRQRLRILGGVRMLGSRTNLQLLHLMTHLSGSGRLQTADIPGMPTIELARFFISSQRNFIRIEHDDEITGVRMASVGGFGLADDGASHDSGEATEDLVLSVHDVPLRRVWPLILKIMGALLFSLVSLLLQHRRLEL